MTVIDSFSKFNGSTQFCQADAQRDQLRLHARQEVHRHNAKEYKELPALDADLQMFTEMLVRMGNLQQMQ